MPAELLVPLSGGQSNPTNNGRRDSTCHPQFRVQTGSSRHRMVSSGEGRNSKAETKWLGPIKETNLSLTKDMCTFKLALSSDMLLGGIRDQLHYHTNMLGYMCVPRYSARRITVVSCPPVAVS
ncbi:unnamed protein product [Fusarium graminearum]|uniref:Chromosome 4, complete genome n=1 Tax=Gibberella zeae (strain ATCC MYA-4620 / CBS 123657 / FGSC 9075 / NRRL 31084 / PH-1) TaxID=229533 RepID=I1S865_GIBZE|nr:hypothetical protein FGSG_13043 [Fusarium graminearum PH-1]ESU13218.1 hypothetical protein FGSG_13043 [Fusarium graminearum PH-1]EYB23858.1 hypothetical protein FG05_13043 [Fusarium graminearum]CEF85547.1 unnamed protein product [Fusarium graminearum]CZS72811.1 unnamed protein product [Fusarium graminearum]|eukprot:XP_011326725.1 hypothetical protein FGSG_13043 [Fusarium graminearum PH-1]